MPAGRPRKVIDNRSINLRVNEEMEKVRLSLGCATAKQAREVMGEDKFQNLITKCAKKPSSSSDS